MIEKLFVFNCFNWIFINIIDVGWGWACCVVGGDKSNLFKTRFLNVILKSWKNPFPYLFFFFYSNIECLFLTVWMGIAVEDRVGSLPFVVIILINIIIVFVWIIITVSRITFSRTVGRMIVVIIFISICVVVVVVVVGGGGGGGVVTLWVCWWSSSLSESRNRFYTSFTTKVLVKSHGFEMTMCCTFDTKIVLVIIWVYFFRELMSVSMDVLLLLSICV